MRTVTRYAGREAKSVMLRSRFFGSHLRAPCVQKACTQTQGIVNGSCTNNTFSYYRCSSAKNFARTNSTVTNAPAPAVGMWSWEEVMRTLGSAAETVPKEVCVECSVLRRLSS